MDRVRGGERVDAAFEQRRLDDLLKRLQPPPLLEEADEPERDPLVGAELVDCEAEKLGRRVDDENSDLLVP